MIQNRLMIMIIKVLIAEIFRVLTYFFYLFIFLKDSEFLVVDNFFENSNFLEWVCQLKKKKLPPRPQVKSKPEKREPSQRYNFAAKFRKVKSKKKRKKKPSRVKKRRQRPVSRRRALEGSSMTTSPTTSTYYRHIPFPRHSSIYI